ncbi:MAG: hypothetical protein JNM80_02850 [Phycisphaerae bacterium]|nr:hypothetical protein [Phycisphaerae bacterium]
MPILTALAGVVPPLLVSALLVLAAWRPWRASAPTAGARAGGGGGGWAASGAVGLSLAVAFPLITGELSLPPRTATGYLPFIGAAAWVIGAGCSTWNKSTLVRALVALVACGLVAFVVLRPMLRHAWPGAGGWLRVGGLGAAAAAVWVVLAPLEGVGGSGKGGGMGGGSGGGSGGGTGGGARVSLALWAGSVAGAVMLLLAESASLAQAAGSVAVGLGVLVVVSWWRPVLAVGAGAAGAWSMAMGGVLLAGHAYAGTPPGVASVVLVLVSPLAAWAGRVGLVSRRPGWQGTLATTALAGAVGGAGAALAAA